MQQVSKTGDGSKASIRTIALASAIGTTIEWYDFFLYNTMTALVLNKLFFPNADILISTLLAYVTSFVGFLSRPIGGVIFGHYGDRIGRKTVLILTVLIMGIATFLIGLLPTYASVGAAAPLMLLALRIFQGIGIGGEWGGAVLMAVEHSPGGRRGFYGSWPQIGVPAGLLISAGVVSALSFLNNDDFFSWGWRIAFLFSAVLVVIGVYIRLRIMETPAFQKAQLEQKIAAVPVVELFRTYTKNTILGLGARYIEGVTFNIYGVFLVFYLTSTLHMSRQIALSAIMISSAIMIFLLPVCGRMVGPLRTAAPVWHRRALDRDLVVPGIRLMDTLSPVLTIIAVAVPFGVIYAAVYGPEAALFSELFDTRVRYTGISFVYQFSGIFASGLTPIIATALLPLGGNQPWLICLYVLVVSVISALSVYAMTDRHKSDIEADTTAMQAQAVGGG